MRMIYDWIKSTRTFYFKIFFFFALYFVLPCDIEQSIEKISQKF
jgi:hypothetical protein